jgi:hypothetical protein
MKECLKLVTAHVPHTSKCSFSPRRETNSMHAPRLELRHDRDEDARQGDFVVHLGTNAGWHFSNPESSYLPGSV